jgi:rare lipoprotein A
MKIKELIVIFVFILACSPSARFHSGDDCSYGEDNYTYQEKAGTFSGIASYYGPNFHGKKTASGEIFDMYKMTCAHRALPFGTELLVTNPENNKSVKVRVNDRGPFVKGVILDLSMGAAQKIGLSKGQVIIKIIRMGR